MILISGTDLPLEALPFAGIMDYTIEHNPQILGIKLKTVAKGESCLGVYLSESLKEQFPLSEDLAEKTVYFKDDEHLSLLLEAGGNEIEEPVVEIVEQDDEEVIVFEAPAHVLEQQVASVDDSETVTVIPTVEVFEGTDSLALEEVSDTELSDTLLSIPNIATDVDSLMQQLESKQRIVDQKDAQNLDLKKSLDDLYKLQEIQLLEMRESYEKRVDEANAIISELKSKVKEAGGAEGLQWFLKYATYSQNYKASLREGFTREEAEKIGKVTSPVHIFASGAGDSLHTMLKNVTQLMEKNPKALYVDFSNDYFMTARYRIKTKDSSLLLANKDVSVESLVKNLNGVQFIPTTFYNDIALLGVDWVTVLQKLFAYAKGRPIIFLFNSISSFSVRYTVSKLATIGKLSVFVKSNPVILATLFGDIKFIPAERAKVVAMNYIEVVAPVLNEIAQKYHVKAFNETVNWKALEVIK